MSDLITFLRARLDEDEQVARAAEEYFRRPWASPDESAIVAGVHHALQHSPARVLAEVEAKRKVIEEIVPAVEQMDDQLEAEFGSSDYPNVTPAHEQLLRLLALPYADHDEYRPEWAP